MNIRRAKPEDVNAIYELGKLVDEFAVNDDTVNFWPKELLAHAVVSNDVLILVAEDETVVGFLIANCNSGLKKALVENIYVRPDKRGQGTGDKLVGQMLKLLPDMGCEYVATLVPSDAKAATNLYTRSGFSQGETFIWLDKALNATFKRSAKK